MKAPATRQKLRGGYYTPGAVAAFLCDWAIRTPAARILEPSFGDGVFLQAALAALTARGASLTGLARQLTGTEIDSAEAGRAIERLARFDPSPESLVKGDFFHNCISWLDDGTRFDAVLGNPPFIRYQNFQEEHRALAFDVMRRAGLHPNRLTNAWVPFLVGASLLTSPTGRLAMVIPAELLQVNYAAELREFLGSFFRRITLLTFRRLLFAEALQEVVLLLGERDGDRTTGIRTLELEGQSDLDRFRFGSEREQPLKPIDHSTEKWTQYFLDEPEIRLLRRLRAHPGLGRFGDVAEVDVGVVTGLNDFFVLSSLQARNRDLDPYTTRVVARSGHLDGLVFSDADWRSNTEREYPSLLLTAPDIPREDLPLPVRSYVSFGESRGWHQGFKCRIRKRWYVAPSTWVPDAFLTRQIHQFPKLILNEAGATCTDTIHRVRFRAGVDPVRTAGAFLTSLTFAFSEVLGRSYGGGVLELEPREAEGIPFPRSVRAEVDLREVRDACSKGDIDSALDLGDKVILEREVGLSPRETAMLRGIWVKLRNRRMTRKPERPRSGSGVADSTDGESIWA